MEGGPSTSIIINTIIISLFLVRRLIKPVLLLLIISSSSSSMKMVEGLWCVARSDATEEALQTGMDYACGSGADCEPMQPNGLCFLPNTLQAHASYAYNSYYQRSNGAAGACQFSGTATLAKTDPSYGSCVYPPSPSTAGGMPSTTGTTPTTNIFGGGSGGASPLTPTTTSPTTLGGGAGAGIGTGGFSPNSGGMGPPIPTTTGNSGYTFSSSVYITVALGTSSLLLPLAVL